MIETDKLLFSNNFKEIELKYTIPFMVIIDLFFLGIVLQVFSKNLLSIKFLGVPILFYLVVVGLLETILIAYKYLLKIDIFFFINIPSLVCLILSIVTFVFSLIFWKQTSLHYILSGLAILFTAPDKRFNNPSLVENISISLIRLFVFTILAFYLFQSFRNFI